MIIKVLVLKFGRKPNFFVLKTRARAKAGDRFPDDHKCRYLLFDRFCFTMKIYDNLIAETWKSDKLVLVLEKKMIFYCFKLFFEYLDKMIVKGLKLQKFGRQDSVDGCGAKKVISFSQFVYVFLDEVFLYLIECSKDERRMKFISFQRQ